MEINDDYNNLPKEIRMQFIKECLMELFPFTPNDIEFYESKLDFKILSGNANLEWSYQLLYKYKEKWDWSLIENNYIITKQISLPLLFPDRVGYRMPKCNCNRKLDFCDEIDIYCSPTINKPLPLKMPHKEILNASVYKLIDNSIDFGVINGELLYSIFFLNSDFTFGQKE